MDSLKINRDEIKEKAIPKPRSFVKERKDKNESCTKFDLHRKLVINKVCQIMIF
jgi:hypothetical protein